MNSKLNISLLSLVTTEVFLKCVWLSIILFFLILLISSDSLHRSLDFHTLNLFITAYGMEDYKMLQHIPLHDRLVFSAALPFVGQANGCCRITFYMTDYCLLQPHPLHVTNKCL